MSEKGKNILKHSLILAAIVDFFHSEMESNVNDILNAEILFDENCSNENCELEIQSLKDEIGQCKAKLKETKDKYHAALVQNLKKDIEIEDLSKKAEQITDELEIFFDTKTQKKMLLVSSSERDDSTYILMAVRYLFRDKIDSLSNYSISGRSKSGAKEIFPEKEAEIIRKIFEKRMASLAEKGVDITERRKPANVNRLLKGAIRNR